MRKSLVKDNVRYQKRALRVRKHLRGTNVKPRLCVVKTNKHIQAQLIDDESGKTLGQASTLAKEFRGTEHAKKCKASAKVLGELIAKIAREQNIKEVVFDRGPFKYHGILAELADAARSGGLQF
jgi:large subunit ribosomal protein L18